MTDIDGRLREFAESTTVLDWFAAAVRESPDVPALRAKNGDDWPTLTFREVGDRALAIAGALRARGIGEGDRVLLMLRNRPAFHILDLAVLLLRATPISVYNSSSSEQLKYLAGHSCAVYAAIDDDVFLQRILSVRDDLPELRGICLIDGAPPEGVESFSELLAGDPIDLDAAVAAAQPDDLITVIYTSGTTGDPKGVMLDHRNIAWEVGGYAALLAASPTPATSDTDYGTMDLPLAGSYPVGRRNVSYLPMAHIAERMVTHYSWLFLRSTVTCCPDQLQLLQYLVGTRPHIIFGPPRVWEKLSAGIKMAAGSDPEKAARLAGALDVGMKYDAAMRSGVAVPPELEAAWQQVDAGAFAGLRAMVGLDAADVVFSGAAPLPQEVAVFLRAVGVPFSEVYGMSENTGGMTWLPFAPEPGTVGKPWPGTEVRLADDGEVLCRGGIVSRGYLNDPVRTAETFDDEGWLHTGDIGEWTDDGHLRIIDRKKELIITAGGKNISPANLEAALKSIPLVGQAAVIGDGRKYITALLVLDPDMARGWAAAQRIEGDLSTLAADVRVLAAIAAGVEEVNSRVSTAEQVKRYKVLADEWLPDSEQLTATMKLKRRGVTKVYGELIEQLYQ